MSKQQVIWLFVMWYLSEICVIYFKITIRSIFSSTLTKKLVIFSRHAWLNKGSRLLFLIRQDSIMLDYCSVIEPMMQQHAVAGGGASTWGMNYNTFSLGINILMFFVVLLVSPQSFVVFRRKKNSKPGGLNANTSVPHVAVDMWQSSFPGRDWKSLAAQSQVKRR